MKALQKLLRYIDDEEFDMLSLWRQLVLTESPSHHKAGVDAAYASQMGIPVVCASGPVVDFQHTKNERVLKSSMAQRAKVHAVTIWNLPKNI